MAWRVWKGCLTEGMNQSEVSQASESLGNTEPCLVGKRLLIIFIPSSHEEEKHIRLSLEPNFIEL